MVSESTLHLFSMKMFLGGAVFFLLFASSPTRVAAQPIIPGEKYIGPVDNSLIDYTEFALEWYYEKEYTSYDLYFGTTSAPPLFRAGLQPATNGPVSGTEQIWQATWQVGDATYPGAFYLNETQLNFSTTYYWRLTTTDENGTLLSSPVYAFTTSRQNTLPVAPALLYPADGAGAVPHTLTLQWQGPTIDADGDEVSYNVYLKQGTEGTPPRIAAGVKGNTYTIPYHLEDQAGYRWYIEAIDGYNAQPVMHNSSKQIWDFTVENYKNNAPDPVALIAPAAGATNTGTTIQFQWTKAFDKDQDAVSYYLYAGTDPDPKTLVDIISGATGYTWHAGNAFQKYYWKVIAYDGQTFSTASAVNSFTPAVTPVPSLTDGATNVGTRPVLTWSATPGVVYDLYLDKNTDPITCIASGLKSTVFCPVLSDPAATYRWKVVARTPQGDTRETTVRSFTPWSKNPGASKPEMVSVKGGTFKMGFAEYERILPGFETWGLLPTAPASPQHTVFVDDYAISRYEVTYTQFFAFLQATSANWHIDGEAIVYDHAVASRWSAGIPVVTTRPVIGYVKTGTGTFDFTKDPKWLWDGTSLRVKPGFEDHPASWISPEGATLYADWAGGRLPTEAEWEYAALGGTNNSSYTYSGSNNIRECAWYLFGDTNPANPMTGSNNGDPSTNNKGTNPVGRKLANALGLYDMTGNIAEYCSDNYGEGYYSHADPFNPLGPLTGTALVNRGGAFDDIQSNSMIRLSRKDVHNYLSENYYQYGVRMAATDDAATTVLVQGVVTDKDNLPLAGIELTDGISKATTNDLGAYQFRVKKDATVHIVPASTEHHFSPAFIDAGSAVTRVTNLNFKAYWNEDYEIKGKVVDLQGKGIDNVRITTYTESVTTDGLGEFSLRVPANRDYTLRAEKFMYKMQDAEITVSNIANDVDNVIFTAALVGQVTISGRVIREGTSFGESHLLMDGLPGTIYTNTEGYYQVQVTAGWSGTVAPVEDSNLSFGYATPVSAVLTDVQQSTTLDFLFMPVAPKMLTGVVVDARGNPLEGVVITGFQDKQVITNAEGVFGVRVAKGWQGTLSAKLDGYTFAPANLAVDVATNGTVSTNPRFVGTPPGDYLIYGTVTDAPGLPLQGATLSGFGHTVKTDINGQYTMWVDQHTSSTLSASMPGYTFYPAQATINNIDADQQQNFTAGLIQNFMVSGHIQDQAGRPIKNITLQGFNTPVSTDTDGNFSTYVPAGWSGIIRPQLDHYTFTPESINITNANADIITTFQAFDHTVTSTESTQQHLFTIYPNPSSGKVTISLRAPGTVQIITTDGHPIWTGQINQTETIELKKSGLYLIKISSQNKLHTTKLLIL